MLIIVLIGSPRTLVFLIREPIWHLANEKSIFEKRPIIFEKWEDFEK